MTAEQLRNSILQEAISGRLVPQDPNDEPAAIVSTVPEDESPFELPTTWKWVRMQDVLEFVNGRAYKKEELLSQGKYRVLRVGNFFTNQSWYYSDLELPEDKYCYNGDLLYAWSASFGPRIWEGEKTIFHYHIWNVKFEKDILFREYLYYFFLYDKSQVKKSTTGSTMIHVSMENMKPRLLPLPPLAEQKRIVAKLEELLPIVEQYGKAQTELDELNAALPARLRQSILQEAISGKLVPQDENETAEGLKEQLLQAVNNSPLKKKWNSEPIEEDELPFDIPENWKWIRLGDIVYTQTGLSYSKGDLEKKVPNPIRVLRGGNIQNGSWCTKDDDVMIAPEFVKKDIFLKKNSFITPAVTSLEHLGKTALIREDHNDIVAGGFVLYLMPYDDKNDALMEYLAYFFQSAFYNSFCKTITNKSGQAFWNISREKLLKLAIPLPPLAEQQRIVAKIEELFAEIDKLK